MKKYNVAIVGATGMIGSKILELLLERAFPLENLYLFADESDAGRKIFAAGCLNTVKYLNMENIRANSYDFVFFSAGGSVSREFAPVFAGMGATVIDNSSAFRATDAVPLIVPEINGIAALKNNGIIANPNCSTIQAVLALYPIHRKYGLRRVIYSTYQSVSGAGMKGYSELAAGKEVQPQCFSKPIFGNIIPQIDVFLENGYTKEEEKMIFETRKILNDPQLAVTATCARVPVFFGHCVSINCELSSSFELKDVIDLLHKQPGLSVIQDDAGFNFPTPLEAAGKDDVYVGRIRRDDSAANGINMWAVSDNTRKGAATNAVQIAEYIIKSSLK